MTAIMSSLLVSFLITSFILQLTYYGHSHRYRTWRFRSSKGTSGHLRHQKEQIYDFSCGHLYYRTLYLDSSQETLFVGAMDKVFRISLYNVNRTRCEEDILTLKPSNIANCISKGKSEHYDCRNHIRVIQPVSGNKLYVCGTNAYNPVDWIVYGL
ncbi:semaphorin-2A-like [Tachypleus tridentatus]|uniref:semaphorin-2A-like n=1 Tax=Tachypleus tridentatus TaxID=6853 RepID=UPI003FD5E622